MSEPVNTTDNFMDAQALLPVYGKLFLMGLQTQESVSVETPEATAAPEQQANDTPAVASETQAESTASEATRRAEQALPKHLQQAQRRQERRKVQPGSQVAPATGSVSWKKPRQPIISFLIPKADYENSACMQLLMKINDALKLPRQSAAFGKVSGSPNVEMLNASPTENVVLFGFNDFQPGTIPGGKSLYQTPSLASMIADSAAKRQAWEVLKPLQHETNT